MSKITKMEEVVRLRLTKAEKEKIREMADKRGVTLSELILSALKIKRKVRKPVSVENNLINQQAA